MATAAVRASLRNPERLFWLPLNKVVLDRLDRVRLSEPRSDRWLLLLLLLLLSALSVLLFSPVCGDWEGAWQARVRPKRDDELVWLLLLHIFVVLSCEWVWFVFILCFDMCLEGERIIACQDTA